MAKTKDYRPETIDQEVIGHLRILDIGTGSGCIAISLARYLPGCRISAIDISAEAVEVAKENARRNDVQDQIDFRQLDMRDLKGQFDIIISNPPYIAQDLLNNLPLDVQQEPMVALDGGRDGLSFYRQVVGAVWRLLKDSGVIFLEMGEGQQNKIVQLLSENGFMGIETILDYNQRPRVIYARLNIKGNSHG